jgi:hypothetical protein
MNTFSLIRRILQFSTRTFGPHWLSSASACDCSQYDTGSFAGPRVFRMTPTYSWSRERPEASRRGHMRGDGRTDLEFGTSGEHVERKSQRNPTRPGCDAPECDAYLVALHYTFARFTMRSRITTDRSRVAEPHGQRPRYGLRKRTAHQMASDDKSHEDASRHQSPPKRPKRTPAFTRAQSPSSRDFAKKKNEERARTKADSKG